MSAAREPRRAVLLAGAALFGCSTAPPVPRAQDGEAPQAAVPRVRTPAVAILEDQLGGSWRVEEILARSCFLIVGGAASSERSTRWDLQLVGPLAQRLGWSVHRVVCLSSYPRLFHAAVASRVRASARPAGVPILLDWDDAIARWLGCAVGDTTVVVLAAGGRELGRVSGEPAGAAGVELERIAGLTADEEPQPRCP